MKVLLFFLLVFFCACSAPKRAALDTGREFNTSYRWQRAIAPVLLSGVSGAAYGVHETVVHHPDRIPASWGPQFWDNRVSWRNKYRGGNPEHGPAYFGSTTVFAWTTDAKHLFGSLHRATLFGAGISVGIGQRRPVWHYVLDAGISFVAFSTGFHGTYSILFR